MDPDLQPLAQGVDHRGAHPVKTAGDLIAPAAELAAGMEMVKTTSRAGLPVCFWMSTGMPRPLSTTRMMLPGSIPT